MNTAWSGEVDDQEWIVIDFDVTMKAVIRAGHGKPAPRAGIVRSEEICDFFCRVNRQLVSDHTGSN